jgi:hypothetical protein
MWRLLLLAALPWSERYAFELNGVPVGVVELHRSGPEYRYVSRHFFRRGDDATALTREERFVLEGRRLPGGEQPASLWLARRPGLGCVKGREELGGRVGEPRRAGGAGALYWGRMLGQPFRARYRVTGELESAELGIARFTRIDGRSLPVLGGDPFAEGFPIEGPGEGALRLSGAGIRVFSDGSLRSSAFSAAEVRAISRQVHHSFKERRPSPADLDPKALAEATAGSCVAHARRFVEKTGGQSEVVLGLLADGGRAWPHAWVRIRVRDGGALELDPTSLEPVTPQTHLRVEGQDYLRLLSGELQVRRMTTK